MKHDAVDDAFAGRIVPQCELMAAMVAAITHPRLTEAYAGSNHFRCIAAALAAV
jgi:hypothetical protein